MPSRSSLPCVRLVCVQVTVTGPVLLCAWKWGLIEVGMGSEKLWGSSAYVEGVYHWRRRMAGKHDKAGAGSWRNGWSISLV